MNVKEEQKRKSMKQSWFFGKVNKRSIKSTDLEQEEWERERERDWFTSMRNETRNITTDPTDNKRIIREYNEQLHIHKFNSVDAMD